MKKNRPKYNQIVEAALEVIAENGYHASQVSKIASKANVADGTIYLYFKNKEDILISVFKEKMGQFIERTVKSLEENQSANEKLLTLIKMHFVQLEQNHSLAIVTQLELRQSKPSLRTEINKVLKSYLNVIDSIVEQGIKEGIYKENINLPLVRQMIFGTLDETVTSWVMKNRRYDIVAQAEPVHKLLTHGLLKRAKNDS